MIFNRFLRFSLLFCAFIFLLIPAVAQNVLNFDQPILLSIDNNNPQAQYTFNASAGDQIAVSALSLTPGFVPTLSIQTPNGETYMMDENHFSPFENTVMLTQRIFVDGSHTLIVQSSTSGLGQVVLMLTQRTPQNATEISDEQAVLATLESANPSLYFFYPDEETPLTLCLEAEDPTVSFLARLYDENGHAINTLAGDVTATTYRIPAIVSPSPQHFYEVALWAMDAEDNQVDVNRNVRVGLTATSCEATELVVVSSSVTDTANEAPATEEVLAEPTQETQNEPTEEASVEPTQAAENEPTQEVPTPTVIATVEGINIPTVEPTLAPTKAVATATEVVIEPVNTPTTDPSTICVDGDGDGWCENEASPGRAPDGRSTDDCPNEPGRIEGCPDRDGDGLMDSRDNCPDETGTANGCPDQDGDGFDDYFDSCPDEAGTERGCPDADGDGYQDSRDGCPSEFGTSRWGGLQGCPDSDGDEWADDIDGCPNEFGLSYYNPYGCPDADSDGEPDHVDACPNQIGESWLDVRGCRDRDGDGYSDDGDACPDQPGFNSMCPDSDGDGFDDNLDNCPDIVGENQGCPVDMDTDGDGVVDVNDTCPTEPGLPGLLGCPDTDGDGVPDFLDACPKEPGSVNGCPILGT